MDNAQIATQLVVASTKPPGYLSLYSGYGSVSFSIQALEPGEIVETMYLRGRTGVGVRGGPQFPARIEAGPSPGALPDLAAGAVSVGRVLAAVVGAPAVARETDQDKAGRGVKG